MTRFDLTSATRDLLNMIVKMDVIDACDAMEFGADCDTPAELLQGILDVIAACQHDRGGKFDAQRPILIDAHNAARHAERKARGFSSARAEALGIRG